MNNKNFLRIVLGEIVASAVVLGFLIAAAVLVFMPGVAGVGGRAEAQTLAQAQSMTTLPPVSANCTVITSNLYFGASDRFISGNNVAKLQAFLKARGYLYVNPTGFYGSLTFSAVRNFQRDNGILAIGLAGPLTRAHIQRVSCDGTVPPVSGAPVINGIDSPSVLSVNQTGTWTVRATDTTSGGLSYRVVWGDESQYAQNSSAPLSVPVNFVQSATFSHSYAQAGVYTPRFYVRGSNGLTAEASASVQVTGSNQTQSPSISYISPNMGIYGTVVTVTGSGFTRYNNSINYAGRVGAVVGVESTNGTTLQFTIPATPCPNGASCAQMIMQPGTYPISVSNQNGTSNSVNFVLLSIDPTTPQSFDQTVSVYLGNTVNISVPTSTTSTGTIQIKPVRIVEDSRCPVGVGINCFQSGRAVIETHIQSGDMIRVVNLVAGSYTGGDTQAVVVVDGYTIQLAGVSPQARPSGIPTNEYVASYRVTR